MSDSVYSPIRRIDQTLLKRLSIELEFVSVKHADLGRKFKSNTRLLYVESPGSLLYEVLDLPALAGLARAHGIPVATDNTWSGGLFHQALEVAQYLDWNRSHPVVRLHIGLESPLDLVADIKQAVEVSNQLHVG